MKELCTICNKWKLQYKKNMYYKCTICAYEYIIHNQTFVTIEYAIVNGHKVRSDIHYLCNGTLEHCLRIFKLKIFV